MGGSFPRSVFTSGERQGSSWRPNLPKAALPRLPACVGGRGELGEPGVCLRAAQ